VISNASPASHEGPEHAPSPLGTYSLKIRLLGDGAIGVVHVSMSDVVTVALVAQHVGSEVRQARA